MSRHAEIQKPGVRSFFAANAIKKDLTPLLAEIPYASDSLELFARFAELPHPVFLDSGGCARYDIIAADPVVLLATRGKITSVEQNGLTSESQESPFALLRRHLTPVVQNDTGLPFCGGAIGLFGYDLGRLLIDIAEKNTVADFPEMTVGIYDWAIVVDHEKKCACLASCCRYPQTRDKWQMLLDRVSAQSKALNPWNCSAINADTTQAQYAAKFSTVKDYIRAGDCYQVNLAISFAAPFQGSPLALYRDLRAQSPAPFSAFFAAGNFSVLSVSPERFLQLANGKVETRPIKGTRPRSNDEIIDKALAEELRTSLKDRAENLMIVDLLRNDLGKACVPGSVQVPELFVVESFASVHHLVSTVRGTLQPGEDALSLFAACFPGGSITGAPKKRAMEIIEQCESSRRGIYCGSIAYVGFDGKMDSNIAIRTLVASRDSVEFRAGGGIVWDSDCEEEYREIHHKAADFFAVLGKPVC